MFVIVLGDVVHRISLPRSIPRKTALFLYGELSSNPNEVVASTDPAT